jgi:hypothetical protein
VLREALQDGDIKTPMDFIPLVIIIFIIIISFIVATALQPGRHYTFSKYEGLHLRSSIVKALIDHMSYSNVMLILVSIVS